MLKYCIFFFLLFMSFNQLQTQIVHNFFGEDMMTIRENNSWVVANSIKEIYELIIEDQGAKTEVRKYTFDHNGLPILIISGTVDTSWVPSMGFDAEVEYQFMYIMEDLFLRRESELRNFKGLMKRENIFSDTKYFNYFNRPHFNNGKGLDMSFYFTPGGRPLEIKIQNTPAADIHYHFSYQSNRLGQVVMLEEIGAEELIEVQSAIYEYDRNNRPERIRISRGEHELRVIEIEYDQRAFPVKKTFLEGDEIIKDVRYFFTIN
jgi:hypothetical protein